MRLNRVLLLAASFICMALAMVFTISCSGDDGKNGRDGGDGKDAICSAAATEGGLTITCDDGTSGFLANGAQGVQGPPGEIPENVCRLGSLKPNGNYQVICGGKDVSGEEGGITGELQSCTTTKNSDNPFEVILSCTSNEDDDFYMCGGQWYDPRKDHCEAWTVPTREGDTATVSTGGSLSYNNKIGVVVVSECGGHGAAYTYDSRYQFCDYSTAPNSIQFYCGANKEMYRTGAPWFDQCGTTVPTDRSVARLAEVTAPCPNPNSAVLPSSGITRIIKAKQFCQDNTTPTDRCGIKQKNYVYGGPFATGRTTSSKINNNVTTYTGDANFSFYARGTQVFSSLTSGIPPSNNPDAADPSNGFLYKGEYSLKSQEQCLNDSIVVKVCGTEFYEESWQFCATRNRVTPHCKDRVVYDPDTRFCSYVGNSDYNIPRFDGANDTWYNAGYNGSCIDNSGVATSENPDGATKATCLQWASTAITYCGYVKDSDNTYNVGGWKWEYCTEPNIGIYSVLRCAVMQEPADRTYINTLNPPKDINERSRCVCIEHAKPLSMGQNGCECGRGFAYNEKYSTGETKYKNPIGTDTLTRLSGGSCDLIVQTTGTCAGNREPKRVKEDGTCVGWTGSTSAATADSVAIYSFAPNSGQTSVYAIKAHALPASDLTCTNPNQIRLLTTHAPGDSTPSDSLLTVGATCLYRDASSVPAGSGTVNICASRIKQYNDVEFCILSSSYTAPSQVCNSTQVTDWDGTCKTGTTAAACSGSVTGAMLGGANNQCSCPAGYSINSTSSPTACRIASAVTDEWCNYGKVKAPGAASDASGCLDDAAACGTAGGTAASGACSCGSKTWFGANTVGANADKCLANCDADQVFTAEGNSECVWKDATSASGSSTVLKVCTGNASTGKFCDNGASACVQTTVGTCD